MSTSEQMMEPQSPPLFAQPVPKPEDRPVWWVRVMLLLIAGVFATIFFIATMVKPYSPTGEPLRMASHESLGLPPCNFKQVVGIPCPSCGMTTSFAMLVRGDIWNSLRANWVGTLLALFLAGMLVWCLICSVRGRYYLIKRFDIFIPIALGSYVVLTLARWVGVLILDRL